jgi:hypothetical protein
MNSSPYSIASSTINNLSSDQRYNLITKLINAEIDERVEEDFTSSGYDTKEEYRDDQISYLCDFLKKDLQSDNA